MNIVFICENNSEIKTIKDKLKSFYNKITRRVQVKEIINDSYKNIAINKIIISIPKYTFKRLDKILMKNLLYKLTQNGAKNIVLSKELKDKVILKSQLYSHNYNILDGRFLNKTSTIEILKYIIDKAETNLNREEISILVNDNSSVNIDIITDIANVAKRVNIVTNNISRFKKLEKKLYEEKGIMLSIGNNLKKGLNKSRYIVNIDFPEELINKYKIYKQAIIINLENKCKIHSKLFSGIVINDIDITYKKDIDEEKLLKIFDKKEIYEAKIIAINSYKEVIEMKKKDGYKVVNAIGNNGVIHYDEYKIDKNLR